MCVCEIMDVLSIPQYNCSRHLKILKLHGFVKESKSGRWVFYEIQNKNDRFIRYLIKSISYMRWSEYKEDITRLKARLELRRNNKCVIGYNNQIWKKVLKRISLGG